MNRLWQSFSIRFKQFRHRRPSAPSQRRFRPTLESLEQRDVLSTLFLVPNSTPVDASHFHSFQSAYQAAHSGDVIQVEPGATVSSVGQGVVGHWLSGGGAKTNTITIDNPNIGAGEWVEVNGGGGNAEDLIVLSAQPNGQGGVMLTLNQPLFFSHNGSGATVTTLGELGITKPITLQGDPNDPPAVVASPLELPPGTSNVVFNNLNFTNPQGLTVDADHQNITVENSTLPSLSMNLGPGNANDLITGDIFTGGVLVNGDPNGLTADHVTNNKFIDNSFLYMINNGDSVVSGNTFTVSPSSFPNEVVVTIINCPSILLYNNSITVSNADAGTTALLLWDSSFYQQSLTAFVENNVFNTGGKGVGLDTSGAVNVMVQGNDFRNNAVGVYLYGNGSTVGNVDLGGGSFGSHGQNNFSTFTAAGIAQGHFAISMHNTSANDQVFAYDNIWSSIVPPNVVKDSYENTNAKEAVYSGFSAGTGEILTVDIQMIPWLRFSQIDPLALALPSSVYVPLHSPDPGPSLDPAVLDAVLLDPLTYSGLMFDSSLKTH